MRIVQTVNVLLLETEVLHQLLCLGVGHDDVLAGCLSGPSCPKLFECPKFTDNLSKPTTPLQLVRPASIAFHPRNFEDKLEKCLQRMQNVSGNDTLPTLESNI